MYYENTFSFLILLKYRKFFLGLYFGFWDLLYSQWSTLIESLTPWVRMRELAIFPPPIRGLYKVKKVFHFCIENIFLHPIIIHLDKNLALFLILIQNNN